MLSERTDNRDKDKRYIYIYFIEDTFFLRFLFFSNIVNRCLYIIYISSLFYSFSVFFLFFVFIVKKICCCTKRLYIVYVS